MAKKSRSWELWAGIGVVVLVVLFATGNIRWTSQGQLILFNPSVSAQGTTSTIQGQTLLVNACNPVPNLQLSSKYFNASANSGQGGFTTVNAPYNVVLLGNTTAYASGRTTATGVVNIQIPCSSTLTVEVGDNVGNYINGTTFTATTAALQPKSVIVESISTPTLKFKNQTSAGYTVYGGKVDNVNNNQVLSGGQQISIQVGAAGSGQCFGNPNYAVQFYANSLVVTSINIPGYSQVTQTLPGESTSFGAGTYQVAYQIPGPLCNYAIQTLNPTVQLATVPPGAANTANTYASVAVYLIPQTSAFYNGAVVSGLYVIPGTSTALGAVTSNTIGINFGLV